MRRITALFFVVCLLLGGVMHAPQVGFAQDGEVASCNCWCTGDGGAENIGEMPPTDCSQTCRDQEERMVVCGTATETPNNVNLNCFTEEACSAQNGVLGNEPAEDCTDGQRYCYPAPEPIDLEISLSLGGQDEVTQVQDFGDYIEIGYQVVLGLGVVGAVVMIMVGGAQYIVAGAVSSQAKQAKDRILHAVIGLVLLLSTYLILQTVNPQLLELSTPKLPMVREIQYTGEDTCEQLEEEGYQLEIDGSGGETCGTSAKVVTGPEGQDVADSQTCVYKTCSNNDESCVAVGRDAENQTKYACLTCQTANPDEQSDNPEFSPSVGMCNSLAKEDTDQEKNYCIFTRDTSMLQSGGDVLENSASQTALAAIPGLGIAAALGKAGIDSVDLATKVERGTCAEIRINCGNIDSCEDYESVQVSNSIETDESLDDLEPSGIIGIFSGSEDLKTICEDDPCELPGNCRHVGETFDDACKPTTSGASDQW